MAAFSYRAYLVDGTPEAGVIDADDARDASRKLLRANKRPFVVEEVGSKKPQSRSGGIAGLRIRHAIDLARLFAELSVLLDAGFNAAAALRIVAASESSARDRTRLLAVSDDVANGRSLSEAFAGLPELSAETRAMIASGESSGRLAPVVSRIADTYRHRAERKAAILEALAYPAFLVVMILAALLFLSLFLMPAIEPIFESGDLEKPIIVDLLSGLGRLLSESWLPLLAATLAAMTAFVALARTAFGQRLRSQLTRRLPYVGRLMSDSAVIRYLETLALLAENGVAMIEALKLAAATSSAPDVRQRLAAIRDKVANGERLQAAFKDSGVFDGPTLTLVGIGEESNSLPVLLKRASILIEARLKRSIDRLLTFLTPAITVAMGLLVGGLVVSVMTALLSINEAAIQ